MNMMQSDDKQQEQMGGASSDWHIIACWARGMAAVVCAWVAFWYAASFPVGHSDKEIETIGRITYCGLPFPWRSSADGWSIMYSWGSAQHWLLPVNLAFWTALSCLLWQVRPRRAFFACMAVAEAPVLLFVGWIYASFLLA